MNNKLANIIIEQRKKMELSRRELARRIGVDQAYLSRIEKGEVGKPSIKILMSLSEELNIDFITLLFKTYEHEEIEMLGIFNNINEVFNFVDNDVIEKVIVKDENNNYRISLKKILDLFKEDKLDIRNTIGLLSCLTNKNLINYLTKKEILEIEKNDE